MSGDSQIRLSLRRGSFGLFAAATLVSLAGDGLFRLAISLQVYALVQNPGALAAVGFAWTLGQFLVLPIAGWASDRYSRRALLIGADIWRGLAIGAIALFSLAASLTITHLVVLGLLFGAGNAFFNPAATSFLPDIVDDERLPRANALLGGMQPVMLYVVGPLAGGAIVGAAGPGVAFALDALTFAVSAALLARIPTPPVSDGAPVQGQQRRSVLDGLRAVAGRRWLWGGMSALAISGLAYHGPFEVLIPFMLIAEFGLSQSQAAGSLASILVASGVGAVLTAWWINRRELPRRLLRVFYFGEALGLLMLAAIGFMGAVWHAVLAGLVIGAMFALTEVIWTTALQRNVPREALGRVSSIDWMLSVGVAPLSFAAAGLLGASLSPRMALVLAGFLGAALLVALSLIPGVVTIRSSLGAPLPRSEAGTPDTRVRTPQSF